MQWVLCIGIMVLALIGTIALGGCGEKGLSDGEACSRARVRFDNHFEPRGLTYMSSHVLGRHEDGTVIVKIETDRGPIQIEIGGPNGY